MKPASSFLLFALILLAASGCATPLFYHPDARSYYAKPVNAEEVWFASHDGTRLHGWLVPAIGEAQGTVVHCHGNAQNLSAHWGFVSWLPTNGYNVFTFDYRGYGKSEGHPTPAGLVMDSATALAVAARQPGVDTNSIFILGQSLGGPNALWAAALNSNLCPRAIVLDSTFSTYRSIVRDKVKLIPVLSWFRWPLSFVLASDRWSTQRAIDRISPTIPLLFLHGTADRVIPVEHSKTLYDNAREPKQLVILEGLDHTGGLPGKGPARQTVLDFMRTNVEIQELTTQ